MYTDYAEIYCHLTALRIIDMLIVTTKCIMFYVWVSGPEIKLSYLILPYKYVLKVPAVS